MVISPTYLYQVRLNEKEMAVVNFVMNDIRAMELQSREDRKKGKIFVKPDKPITIKDKFMILINYYYKKEIKSKE